MNEPQFNLDRALADIAAVSPSAQSTARAMELARNSLPKKSPPQRRWLWPLSIAAALILGAFLAAVLIPRSVSAQEALATTLKAGEDFKGWVHMSVHDGRVLPSPQPDWSSDWDTRTGDTVSKNTNSLGTTIFFRDAVKHQVFEYRSSTGAIRIGDWIGGTSVASSGVPLDYQNLMDQLKTSFGQDTFNITRSVDQGLDRFDFTVTDRPPTRQEQYFAQGDWLPLEHLSTVWVDPKAHLITRIIAGKSSVSLRYGPPELHSIYDAGAPRDARVEDVRPSAEAVAVFDRIDANHRKPFPDGVFITISTTADARNMKLYFRHAANWVTREYAVGHDHGKAGVEIPDHWQTTGADELFRRLGQTLPQGDSAGDGKTATGTEFDPKTGEAYHSYAAQWYDENGKSQFATGRDPGPALYTGTSGPFLERIRSATNYAYPQQGVEGRYGLGNVYDITTSFDHPGLIGVRTRLMTDDPTPRPRLVEEDWVDPAHNYRSVLFTQIGYEKPDGDDAPANDGVYGKGTTAFSDYDTLPAPDGRYYPGTSTETYWKADGKGNFVILSETQTEAHFFPNRALPPIPSHPAAALP